MKKAWWVALALAIALTGSASAAVSGEEDNRSTAADEDMATPPAYAASADAGGGASGAAGADSWRFSVGTGAWAFNMKGPVTLLGRTRYVDASSSEITENMSSAAGFGFEFGKGSWTGMLAVQSLGWEVDRVTGPATDSTALDLDLDYSVVQLGFGYRLPVPPGPKAPTVQFLGLIRASEFQLDIRDSGTQAPLFPTKDFSWTDPLLGVNVVQPIKGRCFAAMAADIGGFGISDDTSQLTWDFMVVIGYAWAFDGWGINLAGGYKAQQYVLQGQAPNATPETFSMDQRMQGPALALNFTF